VPGTTVRLRTDVRNRANPKLATGVHVGGNDAARAAAMKDVDSCLDSYFETQRKKQSAAALRLSAP